MKYSTRVADVLLGTSTTTKNMIISHITFIRTRFLLLSVKGIGLHKSA